MPITLPEPTVNGRILDYRRPTEFGTQVVRINFSTPTPRVSTWIEQGYEQFPYSIFLDELEHFISDARSRLPFPT